jgi:hypothetical protein
LAACFPFCVREYPEEFRPSREWDGFDLSAILPDQKGLSEEIKSLNLAAECGSAA